MFGTSRRKSSSMSFTECVIHRLEGSVLVQHAWDDATSQQLRALVNTMQERCQAVLTAQGGYTLSR